jgi:hypothetical protein
MMPDEKARMLALFDKESRWCRFVEARDGRGHPVHYSDQAAAAWDVVGGMCFLFGWERACELFAQLGRHVTGMHRYRGSRNREMVAMASLQDFNDQSDTTYALVMTKLRDAPVYDRTRGPVALASS